MKRFVLATMGSLVLITSSLEAQRLAVAGGISQPQGELNESSDLGWHGLASIVFSSAMQPLGLRLDVAYNRFPFAGSQLVQEGHIATGSATLNATYRLPKATSPLSPYLIVGLGAYRTSCSESGCSDDTSFGWNFGLGAKLHFIGLGTFLEARYHRTSADGSGVHFFPLTLGLTL
jgi:hypothetical protein